MKNFKSNDRFGGRPNFKKPSFNRDGGDRNRGEMFQTNCANCGKECEVPFKPNGKKPVYCKDCFAIMNPSNDGFAPRKDFGGNSFKPRFEDRGGDRFGKPSFNRDNNRSNDRGSEDMKRSLDAISMKLDKLIQIMGDKPAAKPAAPAEAPAKAAPAKAEKPAKPAKAEKAPKKADAAGLKKALKKVAAPKKAAKKKK